MGLGDWYLTVFSVGVGVSMPAFWAIAAARGTLAHYGQGRDDLAWHVVAEVVTGTVLLAAGLGMALGDPDDRWVATLSALGLGLLVYSLIQSPGHYAARGDRRMLATFALTWAATVPALVLRLVD